ncbi:hypothetical protein [Methanospirillum sp.]
MTKYTISLKTESLTLDDIRLDPDVKCSIPRSIERIGEAVKKPVIKPQPFIPETLS